MRYVRDVSDGEVIEVLIKVVDVTRYLLKVTF
jgi:hypothetical protein